MRALPRMLALAVVVLVAGLLARPAAAFCGFYVANGDQRLFAEATQVVLVRDGLRTVLSMQNDYKGPPEAFAMVVPVPIVLQKENVRTLPRELFDKVDKLGAPRLVEYWEQDPCAPEEDAFGAGGIGLGGLGEGGGGRGLGAGLGVKIEAQFAVGEYEIVVLSAKDSTGLETWLHEQKYAIPAGSEPYLRPYVQSGMKFFVAKVDIAKVKLVDGRAALSPLRFHYDAEQFALPIRLGLVNSSGAQDLVVNILAKDQRYEVANYPNVFIPTNLDVAASARDRFPEFYAALFDATVAKHPGAVVTEYAWATSSCDPCPGPTLSKVDLATLGGDVTAHFAEGNVTLTRLHARYTKDSLGQDLVFRTAPPITGGREEYGAAEQSHGASPAKYGGNDFQARYAIRHGWTGAVACKEPKRGRWGGPPASADAGPAPGRFGGGAAQAAQGLAFAPRGKTTLDAMLAGGAAAANVAVAAVELDGGTSVDGGVARAAAEPTPAPAPKRACGCLVGAGTSSAGGVGGVLVALVALARRRRR